MLSGAKGLCGLLPRWRCAYRGYGFVRSASPVALCLPGLRVCAVCFPGGAALTGATGLCGLLLRWRYASRSYGDVGAVSPVALRLPGLRVCAVCFPGGAALTGATGLCGLFPRWRYAYRGVRFVRSKAGVTQNARRDSGRRHSYVPARVRSNDRWTR